MSEEFGRVKLFHPSGVLVELPVPVWGEEAPDYGRALRAVSAALAAGWLGCAPGLEAGEQREEAGYVVRRSKDNADNTVTPIVDLYPANDATKFAFLSVYLNTDADVSAFQAASGLRLSDLPMYVGDNKIERGKKRELDKLVTKAPRPFAVVLTANPKYDEKEAEAARAAGKMYAVPKRKFVRWADAKPPAGAQPDRPSAEELGLAVRHAKSREEFRAVLKTIQHHWSRFDDDEQAILNGIVEEFKSGALFDNAKPVGAAH
ncbi:MAG: hypothetical protein E6Q76_01095 [Rhizobium sp.]|nr:MAG: hypothetical protein E6Q76_01095 [Rhizobium sp.]